jgi:hypothetical protein
MWGKKTMQEKTTLPKGEDDLSALYIVEGAGRNLDQVSRPKGGQHAFAANLQSQPAAAAQSFYR